SSSDSHNARVRIYPFSADLLLGGSAIRSWHRRCSARRVRGRVGRNATRLGIDRAAGDQPGGAGPMWIVGRFRRLSVTAKLVRPFFTIFTLTVVLLGSVFVETQSASIGQISTKKAEILTRNLAAALGEPVFLGDRDLAQKLAEAANKIDDDVMY